MGTSSKILRFCSTWALHSCLFKGVAWLGLCGALILAITVSKCKLEFEGLELRK